MPIAKAMPPRERTEIARIIAMTPLMIRVTGIGEEEKHRWQTAGVSHKD
jgi:hypothetical protein